MKYIPCTPEWYAVIEIKGEERWFRIGYWIVYGGTATRAFCPTFGAAGGGAMISPEHTEGFVRYAFEGDG